MHHCRVFQLFEAIHPTEHHSVKGTCKLSLTLPSNLLVLYFSNEQHFFVFSRNIETVSTLFYVRKK